MEEITFSVFNHGTAAMENLRTLLEKFENQFGIHVRLEVIRNWTAGWTRLVENALYRNGPDISEAGNTWIGDLARMDALHPFEHEEVLELTKDIHLFDNLWRSRIRDESGKVMIFSIPWTVETRAVFYRRDFLEKIAVDESNAFIDTAHFEDTISTLKEKGYSMPLLLTTRRSSLTVHYIASWVWSAGGEFLCPDGISLAFDQPLAMKGLISYFRLGRYICEEARNMDEEELNLAFRSGRAAVTLNGYWMLDVDQMSPDVRGNFGVTSMPGLPFVGGQDLVIWKHSRHKQAGMKLIQFLNNDESGRQLFPFIGLPVSENAWKKPPFDSGFYPVFKLAIQNGRGFKGLLWGLVEKRLTDEFSDIWAEVLKSPESKLDIIVETHMHNLAHRLQLSMGS